MFLFLCVMPKYKYKNGLLWPEMCLKTQNFVSEHYPSIFFEGNDFTSFSYVLHRRDVLHYWRGLCLRWVFLNDVYVSVMRSFSVAFLLHGIPLKILEEIALAKHTVWHEQCVCVCVDWDKKKRLKVRAKYLCIKSYRKINRILYLFFLSLVLVL